MTYLAVSVAVIEDEQVLLTLRDDFRVWCLPSGGVDPGESVAEAALRETLEETGVEVELRRVVGIYSRLGALPEIHATHFLAKPVGGEIRTQPGETVEVRYFPLSNLPNNMIYGHKRRVLDAATGSEISRTVIHRFRDPESGPITRQELLSLRDESPMNPSDFYMDFLGKLWVGDEDFVLGG